MTSLVADYGDSSASENEESTADCPEHISQTSHKDLPTEKDPLSFNYYLGYDEDFEDDASPSHDPQQQRHKKDDQTKNKMPIDKLLPKPNFDNPDANFGHTESKAAGASVFANPFLAAEEAKNLLLEKHVKMTPTTTNPSRGGGGNRQVCWNFRKGRCRFGHNCKFGHDSDLHLTNRTSLMSGGSEVDEAEPPGNALTAENRNGGFPNRNERYGKNVGCAGDSVPRDRGIGPEKRFSIHDAEDESSELQRHKRKKPGLTNTLLPPKRSMKSFKSQQQQDRPWLSK